MNYIKAIASLLAVLLLTLLLFSLFSCTSGNPPVNSDSDTTENTADSNDTGIGTIYIPIENDDSDNTTRSQQELKDVYLASTRDLGDEYIAKLTFLCDFSIYGLKSYSMLAEMRTTDRVISGAFGSYYVMGGTAALVFDSKRNVLVTPSELISHIKPEFLIISIGIADIIENELMTYDTFEAAYSTLLDSLKSASPKTVFVCMSVLPASKSDGIALYEINKYNSRILNAAADNELYYLDITSPFAASDGYLRDDCDGGSSRLNTTGLNLLLELLATHAVTEQESYIDTISPSTEDTAS